MEMIMSTNKEDAQRDLVNGPPAGSRWRHFKGGTYRVRLNAVHESTGEHMVCYESEEYGYVWVRSLADFLGVHPGAGVQRFERVE